MAALLCAAMSSAVLAAGPSDIRKTAEASMLVTGWIEVMPDGSVHDYSIDHPEKIPLVVLQLIKNNVPSWKFKLDDKVAVIERARMNLRILAKRVDDTHNSIGIIGATFGETGDKSSDIVSEKYITTPRYPRTAVDARVDGTVFLLLRIGKQGQVEDVAAEQVNLGEYGSENQMRYYRGLLEDAALKAAREWTFNTPTTGKQTSYPYWYVRVPVNFNIHTLGHDEDTYGKWEGYIPGPRQPIAWLQAEHAAPVTPDAIPTQGLTQLDPNLSLATPLAP
ncbi:energy transducer TonB [Dyella psychrodurans]|uniref:Energy transducer TonB n=1 Tax=Dyella psychrodurans TaxID=1927960 RepID=A0A370X454_9GAMM|nr:energy transducer TonB [Dyella psychrodurans]RDS83199.1 energy transducer TonB [Dyella psychrodurans]